MRASPPLAVPAAALASLLAVTTAPADEWVKTYPVAASASLRLVTGDGNIRVVLGPDRQVTIRVTTQGWRIGPGQVLVQSRQDGDRVEVEVREPRFRFDLFGPTRRIEVEAIVPRDSDLFVWTGDGSVRVPGVRGVVDLRSGDGSVSVEDVEGELRIRTGDGRIRAQGIRGSLQARSGDGRVEVAGRFERLDLRSGDGLIAVEVEEGSRLAAPWTVVTGDGSMVLRIPGDLAADFDISTRDGRIDLDVPVTLSGRFRRNVVQGTLQGGGPLLRLRSGDGRIRIAPL